MTPHTMSLRSQPSAEPPRLWVLNHLRQRWLSGICAGDISNFLDSIPSSLWPSLERSLKLLECVRQRTIVCLNNARSDGQPSRHAYGLCKIEKEMWEAQSECGFMQIDFEPKTGERIGVTVNHYQAIIWNMSKPQLLRRLIHSEMPLMIPSLDLLSLLVDEILSEFDDKERLHRTFSSLNSRKIVILVHHCTTSRFNADGQLCMVIAL